jgi:heterodisulfide reductase subunit A-like polyferredoxin
VARAKRLQPLEPTEVAVTPHVLVMGAGLPGMKAASDLRGLGFAVTLIEAAEVPGGLVRELHSLYPDGRQAQATVAHLSQRLKSAGVDFRLGTRVKDVSGFVGNFHVTLESRAGDAPTEPDPLEVGAIIVAIGADTYTPAHGEFGYGVYDNVITSVELEHRLASGEGLPQEGSVAFIQCVGSREKSPEKLTGAHPHYPGCSRICCPTTVKQALELRTRGTDAVVFYHDMRMVGCGAEELYRDARAAGTAFVRVPAGTPPQVSGEAEHATHVTATDALLRAQVRMPADLVVLAVGLVPRSREAERIREMLKTPQGPDGFFLERHPELGPVETCVDGVIVCGTAQGPKDLPDSLAQASAGAAKAAALLGSGQLFLDPATCEVDMDRCRACGLCVSLCDFQAPSLVTGPDGRPTVRINRALCKGCGTCAVWCPTGAIAAQHFTDDQITAMIDTLFVEEAPR